MVTKQRENKKAIYVVPASVSACAFIIDSCYAEEDKSNNKYEQAVLANPRLLNMELHQTKISTEGRVVHSSQVLPVATGKSSVSKKVYVSYREPESAS